jgi:hypothetical protein
MMTNNRLGDVQQVVPMKRMPAKLGKISDGFMVAYTMPAVKGGETVATGMLFVPEGDAPAGGWPLLVYGHDTEGTTHEAAPSAYIQAEPAKDLPHSNPARWAVPTDLVSFGQPAGYWRCDHQIAEMVKASEDGMVVFCPDYEGMSDPKLGAPDTGHPYFQAASMGRSMAFGALAAKRHLGDKLSGKWAASGFSEGGFACIAAAEYSSEVANIEPSMDFCGAVGFSVGVDAYQIKVDQWSEIEMLVARGSEIPAQGALGQFQHHAFPLLNGFLASGEDFTPEDVLGERALKIYNSNPRMAHYNWAALTREDIASWVLEADENNCLNYPGAYNSEKFLELCKKLCDTGNGEFPGKILIVNGGSDSVTRPDIVINRVNKMIANGNDVSLCLLQNCDHFNVLQNKQGLAAANGFLRNIFS